MFCSVNDLIDLKAKEKNNRWHEKERNSGRKFQEFVEQFYLFFFCCVSDTEVEGKKIGNI